MTFYLTAKSDAGRRAVAAANELIPTLAAGAAAADESNQLNPDNFKALVSAGVAGAFVPETLGGFGLNSVHDWTLMIATLARGDASTAIAINMQLGISRGMAHAFTQASKNTGSKAADRLAVPLQQIQRGEMLICATATEAGTDNLHPLTEAVATGDGWSISGRKMFVTMSPIATHLGMNLRMRDADGDHLVTTLLPMQTEGIQPQDDWDALGMRGSGSQSVVFDNVKVAKSAIRKLGPWGEWSSSVLLNRAVGNLTLVGAFLGVAEAAHQLVLEKLKSQRRNGALVTQNAGVQHHIGELEIELAQCQSILGAATSNVDAYLERYAAKPAPIEESHRLMKDYQAAKWVVNRGAINVVSKAMDLMGGVGYTNSHALARLYRDVRAGPFMQPFSPTELRQYVGQVALEQWPLG